MTLESLFNPAFDDVPERTTVGQPVVCHITNQTGAGGSPEFPVLTDAVLFDLKIILWYADGGCREVVLTDIDGIPQDTLDTRTVYLEGVDLGDYSLPLEGVTVSGAVSSSVIDVQTEPDGPIRVVRVGTRFWIDLLNPLPDEFLTITVSDREGCRYAVGTIVLDSFPERMCASDCFPLGEDDRSAGGR